MRWYSKCLMDTAKAFVPFHGQLRRWKHRLYGCPPDPVNDDVVIDQGFWLGNTIQSRRPIAGMTILEIGTGWKPILPILYVMAGAERVLLTDVQRLCSPATLLATADSLRQRKQSILSCMSISEAQFEATLSWKASWRFADTLRHLRLEYLAPCDCQHLDLPEGSVDAVTSRAVLEHIPPRIVEGIFRESFRILRTGGLSCHIIDNSDHWQHGDASLSRLNFLRFSESVFRWTYLNSLNYQNRLRHHQYLELLEGGGFSILREEGRVDSVSLQDLARIPLAKPFRSFAPEELAVLTTYVVALKAGPRISDLPLGDGVGTSRNRGS